MLLHSLIHSLTPRPLSSDATSDCYSRKRRVTDDDLFETTRIWSPPCRNLPDNDQKHALQKNVITPVRSATGTKVPTQKNQLSVKAFFRPVDRRATALSKSRIVNSTACPDTSSHREEEQNNDLVQLNSQLPRLEPFVLKKEGRNPLKGKSSTASNDAAKTETPSKIKYEQLVLDYGQRGLGAITCKECGMSYNRGQNEDDLLHGRYHDAVVGGIDYPGYKSQVLVDSIPLFGGELKIFMLTWRPKTRESRKIREILNIVDTELGSVELSENILEGCKIYITVNSKRKVVGCAVAIPIKEAYRVMISTNDVKNTEKSEFVDKGGGKSKTTASNVTEISEAKNDHDSVDNPVQEIKDYNRAGASGETKEGLSINADESSLYCSKKAEPALCGISRIWVSRAARRQSIALRLLEAVRND